MQKFKWILLILCIFVVNCFSIVAADSNIKTLFVSGVEDKTDNDEWNNLLIAYGIRSLIEEELFQTGLFVPIETNPEIQGQIDKLIQYSWRPSGDVQDGKMVAVAKTIGSDVIVSGVVKNFKKKRSGSFMGPFSSSKVTISFIVELSLNEKGKIVCSGSGKGKGVTKSSAVLFQIRKDKVNFDKTTVGRAAHKAIRDAVQEMVKKYETHN